jgi:hypothetical protein
MAEEPEEGVTFRASSRATVGMGWAHMVQCTEPERTVPWQENPGRGHPVSLAAAPGGVSVPLPPKDEGGG